MAIVGLISGAVVNRPSDIPVPFRFYECTILQVSVFVHMVSTRTTEYPSVYFIPKSNITNMDSAIPPSTLESITDDPQDTDAIVFPPQGSSSRRRARSLSPLPNIRKTTHPSPPVVPPPALTKRPSPFHHTTDPPPESSGQVNTHSHTHTRCNSPPPQMHNYVPLPNDQEYQPQLPQPLQLVLAEAPHVKVDKFLNLAQRNKVMFAGKAEDLLLFLNEVDQLAQRFDFSDGDILRVLPYILKDPVKHFFTSHRFNSFQHVKEVFRERYLPTSYPQEVLTKLLLRKQKLDESPDDYICEMLKLSKEVSPTPREMWISALLRENLNPRYNNLFSLPAPFSIAEFEQECQRITAILRREAAYSANVRITPVEPGKDLPKNPIRCYGCQKPGVTVKECGCRAAKVSKKKQAPSPSLNPPPLPSQYPQPLHSQHPPPQQLVPQGHMTPQHTYRYIPPLMSYNIPAPTSSHQPSHTYPQPPPPTYPQQPPQPQYVYDPRVDQLQAQMGAMTTQLQQIIQLLDRKN